MANLSVEAIIQDQDKAAHLVRILLASKRMSQIELAKRMGINRCYVNGFLQRHINLLSQDIEKALKELEFNNSSANRNTLSVSLDV